MKLKEKRTQNLYDTLLHSGHIEEQFENIINECKRNGIKYKDPDFYPQKIINSEDEKKLKDHEWRRLEDQYPISLFENINPESIIQGELGDCYFITGLIYASHYKDLVKTLFHHKSSLKYGVVLVYFWYLGERIPVIVDTQVAYSNKCTSIPLFSRPRTNDDSCWFVLVEKAYAKACGGYSVIQGGQISFGIHLMFDYFSAIYNPISNIIPIRSLEEAENEIIDSDDKIFQILTNLNDKKAMIGTATPEEYSEDFNESLGIIKSHAYIILELKEYEKMRFIKLRNPWGESKYKGPFSNGSNEWNEDLKSALNYKDIDDGSFWMPFNDFLRYFSDVNYSLQKEISWKEMSVYGKIEGYLDGRSPCMNSPDVGCIPQWSIKFSKKTVVRFSYDLAGPESYHSLYVCETQGRKVSRLNQYTKIMRSTSKASVNGIEYNVEDFTQPLTFFFTRIEANPEPCYYRILIQSPDSNYRIKRINDNFIKEKWDCFTDKYVFDDNENDICDPSKEDRPLSTCKQWYIYFPDLRYDEEAELRFRIYKNISEGPLYLYFARTDKRLRYSHIYTDLYDFSSFENFEIFSKSKYEEFSIPINRKHLAMSDNSDSFHYVFAFYRKNKNDVDQFKFSVLSRSRFKCGLMPEPDRINDCCYQIKGSLHHGENDGAMPDKQSVEKLKQWCLLFKESSTTLYIEYFNNNTTSDHFIFLERQKEKGDKIRLINRSSTSYQHLIPKNCIHDLQDFEIEDDSRPYALCVTRKSSIDTSEFTLNIYGNEEFEIFEINNNGIGKKIEKYHYKTKEKKIIDFPEVEFIDQPVNFTPKKYNSKLKINNIILQNAQYSISDYILKNITDQIILENPKKKDLQSIRQYHKFNLKFKLPNNNIITIKNYIQMNFFEIFDSLSKEGFYYSETCIRNNFYIFPAEDELFGEFYEELEMDETSSPVVSLKYGKMQFILTENEMASEAYNLLRKAFEDSDSISIQTDQNKELKYIYKLQSKEKYTIHVLYKIMFKFSNDTFSTQYMDYLSTVSDAKNQLAVLFNKDDEQFNPDYIIILDHNLHILDDDNLMLKDIQDLKKLFHFQIDDIKLKSEKINQKANKKFSNSEESEKNESSIIGLKENSLSKNDQQKKSSNFEEEEEESKESIHSKDETEIQKQKKSPEFTEEESKDSVFLQSTNEKIKLNKDKSNKVNLPQIKKEKLKPQYNIKTDEEESNDSLSFINDSNLFNQSKFPKHKSNHKDKSKQLSKEKRKSLSKASDQEQRPKQHLNVIFICEKLDEAFFNPLEKDLPLDTTIGEIQEMISYEFILPKDQLTIKYRDEKNKIIIDPQKTINDIKEKMIEKQNDGKYRNYLYFDFGNTFTTIDKYKGTCKITPNLTNPPYKYNYYNDDKTYSPKILKSPIINKKFQYHMRSNELPLSIKFHPQNNQEIPPFSPPEPISDKTYFIFEYEGTEVETPFPEDLLLVNVENIVKKMLNVDPKEDINFVIVKSDGEERYVDKNKTSLNLLKNTKIKMYHKNQYQKPLISYWYKLDHHIFEIELDSDATVKTMKKEIARLNKIKQLSRIRIFLKKQELPDNIYIDFLDAEDHLFRVKIEEKEIFLITETPRRSDEEDNIEEEEEDI